MTSWQDDSELEQWLKTKRAEGFSVKELSGLIEKSFPDYPCSVATVKRMLSKFEIRIYEEVPRQELHNAVQEIAESSGGAWGYRHVTHELRSNKGILAKRDRVMEMLREVDPDGVQERTPAFKEKRQKRPFVSNGPNYLVSMDGHDKLAGYQCSTYDLHIYGALDTFSRKVLFMWIGQTNKDPKVIGKVYLDYLDGSRMLPRRIRLDKGTETGYLAAIQMFLMERHGISQEDVESVLLGPSTDNKIERLWRDVREKVCNPYKLILNRLSDDGLYDPTCQDDREILAGVFVPVIEKDLDKFVRYHNTSRIKSQSNVLLPTGAIPEHMYQCPEYYAPEIEAEECGIHLSQEDVDLATAHSELENTSVGLTFQSEIVEASLIQHYKEDLEIADLRRHYALVRSDVRSRRQ